MTRATSTALSLTSLAVAALCLRAPISSVGPVIGPYAEAANLNSTEVSLLTSLPLLLWGVFAPIAPWSARRLGARPAVALALGFVVAGVVVRSLLPWGVLPGTLLIGVGIAAGNVLLIVVAKDELGSGWPRGVGLVTASLSLSASLGALLSRPAMELLGSAPAGLALWAAPTALALVVWLLTPGAGRHKGRDAAPTLRQVLRDPVARDVSIFFGLQALMFFTMLTWIATILVDRSHASPTTAGLLAALLAVLGVPAGLIVPRLAARTAGQGTWVLCLVLCVAVGIAGLLLAPGLAVLWVLLCGAGTGASFPLAMTIVGARSGSPEATAALSSAAQSIGYVIAALGPLAVGWLMATSGGWTIPLTAVLCALGVQLLFGLRAGRPNLAFQPTGERIASA